MFKLPVAAALETLLGESYIALAKVSVVGAPETVLLLVAVLLPETEKKDIVITKLAEL